MLTVQLILGLGASLLPFGLDLTPETAFQQSRGRQSAFRLATTGAVAGPHPIQDQDGPSATLEGEVFQLAPAKSITVDLKTQTLTAMENGVPVMTMNCSTGRKNGTPPGDWPVKQKLRWNVALPEYNSVPIPYSLRLDIVYKGKRYRIAIHAHNHVPRYPASHGCIRLRYPDAIKLFNWAEIGVIVNIR